MAYWAWNLDSSAIMISRRRYDDDQWHGVSYRIHSRKNFGGIDRKYWFVLKGMKGIIIAILYVA